MALAFSAAANNTAGNDTVVTVTVTINNGDYVVVSASACVSTTATYTTVTDNNLVAFTFRGRKRNLQASVESFVETWTLAATAGATSVICTCDTALTLGASVATYTGSPTFGTTAEATADSGTPTVSLTTQDNDNFVVSSFTGRDTAAYTDGPNGTIRTSGFLDGAFGRVCTAIVDNTAGTPSSVTTDVTNTSSVAWAVFAIELRVPVAGGGTRIGVAA